MMKIHSMKVGDKRQLNCLTEERKPAVVVFTILELSVYPSPVKDGVYFTGAQVQFPGGEKAILSFMELEFSEPVA